MPFFALPSSSVTEADVRKVLSKIIDPKQSEDLVSLGMVTDLAVRDGNVVFAIKTERTLAEKMEPVRKAAEQAVLTIPGVKSVSAVLTSHRAGTGTSLEQQPKPQRSHNRLPEITAIPGVKTIVVIASGKGGVGKSTVAANLSVALAANGLRTGLMDTDIYGPSIPRMMGAKGRPDVSDGKLIPKQCHGVTLMSIGFLVDEETPLIWRGPMVAAALNQLLRDVIWGELDIMIVDMPPGTGDAQLTMSQSVPISGAIIVSTPQDVALIDARRGLAMFRKVNVPIIGIIENMSYFLCPNCGHRSEVFAHGGAEADANRLSVPFLGEIPLDSAIRIASDRGIPITIADPQNPHARLYSKIAQRLSEAVIHSP